MAITGGGFAVAALYGTLALKADRWAKGLQDSESAIDRFAGKVTRVGQKLTTAITVPLVGLATDAMRTAMSFESAFTGVEKTVDATTEQYAALKNELIELSKVRPMKFEEIALIAEKAGQMGVPVEDIVQFTDTLAQLATTTDIMGETGALRLGQFINIMQDGTDEAYLYGAALAWLGNNLATTESNLLHLSQRFARHAAPIGFTAADVMATSAAAAAAGIRPEEGGSSLGRIVEKMQDAVFGRKVKLGGSDSMSGAEALRRWGEAAGMTADQFKALFQADPMAAFTRLFEGLNRLSQKGGDLTGIIQEMGFGHTIRMRQAAVALSQNADDLRLAMEGSRRAVNDTLEDVSKSPLWIEASKRYEDYASRMEMFSNRVRAVKEKIGIALLPILSDLLVQLEPVWNWIERMSEAFQKLDPKWQRLIFLAIGFVAAIGPVMMVLGSVIKAFGLLASAVGALFSPLGAIVAVIAAVGFGLYQLYMHSEAFRSAIDGVWQAIQRGVDDALPHFKAALNYFADGEWLEGFKEIGRGLQAVWEEVWPAIKDAAVTTWNEVIWPFLTETLPQWLESAWDWAYPRILDMAQRAWRAIRDAAEFVWDTYVWPFLTDDIPRYVRQAFGYLAENIPRWASETFTATLEGFKRAWHESIQPWLHNDLPDLIYNAIVSSPDRLAAAGRWYIETMWSNMQFAWEYAVVPWFKALPGVMYVLITQSPAALIDAGWWIIHKILEPLASADLTIRKWVWDLVSKIGNAARSLKLEILAIGREIAQAIFEGYRDALPSYPWAGPLQSVLQVARMAWDARSPSREWARLGVDAADGLWQGFKAQVRARERDIPGLMGPFRAAMQAINAELSSMLNTANTKAGRAAQALADARSYNDRLAAAARNAAAQMFPAAPQARNVNEFIAIVANLLNTSQSSIAKGAGGLWKKMGQSAVNDFLRGSTDGLAGMGGGLSASYLKLLAEIDRALHGSPVYLTYHWGEDMAKDLVAGFSTIQPGGGVPLNGGGMGSGGTTIQVIVQGDAVDAPNLARRIADALAVEGRRVGGIATVGAL